MEQKYTNQILWWNNRNFEKYRVNEQKDKKIINMVEETTGEEVTIEASYE